MAFRDLEAIGEMFAEYNRSAEDDFLAAAQRTREYDSWRSRLGFNRYCKPRREARACGRSPRKNKQPRVILTLAQRRERRLENNRKYDAARRERVRLDSERLAAHRKYQREWHKAKRVERGPLPGRRLITREEEQRIAALWGTVPAKQLAEGIGVHLSAVYRARDRGRKEAA